jgi:chitin disaccharide deacetylase
MTIRLIVNADDYGRSANISRAIRDSHTRGIVSSTTCMMNMPTVVDDIKIVLSETPRLGLGVHLVLTADRPLLPVHRVSTLTQPDGSFLKLDQLIANRAQLDPAQVKAEWQAQIEKFVAAAGHKPTHLDSHHHSSYFTPDLFRSMLELAKEYDTAIRLPVEPEARDTMAGIPAELFQPIAEHAPRLLGQFRPRHPDAFFASFYDDLATSEELLRILDSLKDGTFEIMTHPGYSDPELAASSGYAVQREHELAVLTAAETLAEIKKRNIDLIHFGQL